MSQRMRRVDEVVRQVVAETVSTYIADPRVGFVTITDVRTTPDLRHSDVYVSVLGGDDEMAAALEGLESAHGRIQAEIGRQLTMKRTPTLSFKADSTAAQAERVEEILREQGAGEGPE